MCAPCCSVRSLFLFVLFVRSCPCLVVWAVLLVLSCDIKDVVAYSCVFYTLLPTSVNVPVLTDMG